jgi:hexose oxidase
VKQSDRVRRRTFIGLLGGAAAAAPFATRAQELDQTSWGGLLPLNSAVDETKQLVGDALQMGRAPTRGRDKPLILSDRQGFNRRWYASTLEAVYVPTELDEVARCVGAALSSYGRDVKVTSGRHCYENFVYNESVRAVIDMSALNQVGFDPMRRAYFIDAGCEIWTVYRTLLNGFGKTLPAGSCGSVGAGGHITGGGFGVLSRMLGLTVDYLTGVDIVTWDAASRQAQLRHVSEVSIDSAERDLFWALRGAGCGNFGVIVRYYFAELPDAPDYVTLWTRAWNWNDLDEANFGALLAEYLNLVEEMPETDFCVFALNHVAAEQISLFYQIASPPGVTAAEHRQSAAKQLQPIQDRFAGIAPSSPLKRPLGGHRGPMSMPKAGGSETPVLTYLEALQTTNGSGPSRFGKHKSAYMKKGFPDNQIKAIYHWLHVVPASAAEGDMALSLLQIDSYGGRINQVSPTVTPVPQRSAIMKLQYQTYWMDAGDANERQSREQMHLDWINQFYAAVYAEYGGVPDPAEDPDGTVDGCYFNYPDVDLGSHERGDVDRALRLYFLDNFRKNPRNLVAIKQLWDPQNYFHHAQSLPVK